MKLVRVLGVLGLVVALTTTTGSVLIANAVPLNAPAGHTENGSLSAEKSPDNGGAGGSAGLLGKASTTQTETGEQGEADLGPVDKLTINLLGDLALPWASPTRADAMLVRDVFTASAAKMSTIMAPFAPDNVTSTFNVAYRAGSPNTELDVYWPEGTTTPLPTIVWTHGGAWLSGSKDNNTSYYQLLASKGYTVVGLNYSYGPETLYPQALFDINDALAFTLKHASEFNIDPNNIFLAGDSAGAQLSSQIAALTTNPTFASDLKFTPALAPDQIRGLILNCGVYDLNTFLGGSGVLGWGQGVTMWAYTGQQRSKDNLGMKQMSTINFATADFPPSYITGGNGDPLTKGNSKPFAAKLESLGVDVTTLFWPDDYTPSLPHEYQFRLDLDAAWTSLTESLAFVAAHTVRP
jgi:acetyl esterase